MKKNIDDQIEESVKYTYDIDYKDLYVRLYADMENLKKRHHKEKEELLKSLKYKMVESILDMDNDLSIAIRSFDTIPDGIKLILNKLKTFLESQNIKEIPVENYDPEVHEVISVIENGESKIVDVVSKGYKMGDSIIRYPKIILSK